jgi:hypothetical protein
MRALIVGLLLPALSWAYPVEVLPEGNTTNLAMAHTQHGQQLVALGADAQLWHLYTLPNGSWAQWSPLTKFCPSFNDSHRPCVFDSDPAIGVNADGRLEVFARFHDNLDMWQMHQTDPSDPTKWSIPRESSCVDQDQNTATWWCVGMPAGTYGQPAAHFWVGSPIFSTSNPTVLNHPTTGAIELYFRGFEGHMYEVHQLQAGNSTLYSEPKMFAPDIIVE